MAFTLRSSQACSKLSPLGTLGGGALLSSSSDIDGFSMGCFVVLGSLQLAMCFGVD